MGACASSERQLIPLPELVASVSPGDVLWIEDISSDGKPHYLVKNTYWRAFHRCALVVKSPDGDPSVLMPTLLPGVGDLSRTIPLETIAQQENTKHLALTQLRPSLNNQELQLLRQFGEKLASSSEPASDTLDKMVTLLMPWGKRLFCSQLVADALVAVGRAAPISPLMYGPSKKGRGLDWGPLFETRLRRQTQQFIADSATTEVSAVASASADVAAQVIPVVAAPRRSSGAGGGTTKKEMMKVGRHSAPTSSSGASAAAGRGAQRAPQAAAQKLSKEGSKSSTLDNSMKEGRTSDSAPLATVVAGSLSASAAVAEGSAAHVAGACSHQRSHSGWFWDWGTTAEHDAARDRHSECNALPLRPLIEWLWPGAVLSGGNAAGAAAEGAPKAAGAATTVTACDPSVLLDRPECHVSDISFTAAATQQQAAASPLKATPRQQQEQQPQALPSSDQAVQTPMDQGRPVTRLSLPGATMQSVGKGGPQHLASRRSHSRSSSQPFSIGNNDASPMGIGTFAEQQRQGITNHRRATISSMQQHTVAHQVGTAAGSPGHSSPQQTQGPGLNSHRRCLSWWSVSMFRADAQKASATPSPSKKEARSSVAHPAGVAPMVTLGLSPA